DPAFYGWHERERIAAGDADQQTHALVRELRERKMDLRKTELLHVLLARRFIARSWNDPDDGEWRRIFLQRLVVIELFADWVVPGKPFFRETFIDHNRGLPAGCSP